MALRDRARAAFVGRPRKRTARERARCRRPRAKDFYGIQTWQAIMRGAAHPVKVRAAVRWLAMRRAAIIRALPTVPPHSTGAFHAETQHLRHPLDLSRLARRLARSARTAPRRIFRRR